MKRVMPHLLLVLMTIVLIASSPAVAASSGPKPTKVVTYTATQDATVSRAKPDANFGEGLRLLVRAHDPVLRTYLRFDLHRPIDAGRIVGALLTLTSPTGDGCVSDIRGVDAYTVSDDWTEDTITFNNAPAPIAYNTSADTFGPGPVLFDVTADFTETDVATYVLKTPADCDRLPGSEGDLAGTTRFNSTESATGWPTLEVEYCRLNHSDDYC